LGYLFVTYSRWERQSNPEIDRLLDDLRVSGVRLWLVPDDVPPGVDWNEILVEKLVQADGLLFLFSRAMNRTPQAAREVETARARRIPFFPVVFQEKLLDQLTPELLEADPILIYENYDTALKDLIARLPDSVVQNRPVKVEQPKSKGYIFISYAEEDTTFVNQLRQFLKERGYGYWDYQDSDRNYQTQLFLELEAVIQNASATLSVLSPDWKRSAWAAKEYLFSEEVGVPVFLLMAREMGPTLVTAGVPYIDFMRDAERGFEKLDRELRKKGLI
jgi:hypothetical protein